MDALYHWLISVEAFSGLLPALIVAIVIPATAFFLTRISAVGDQVSLTVTINVPRELIDKDFYIRHVRNGAVAPAGAPAYVEDKRFPQAKAQDLTSSQTLRFPRRVGIVFKAFVQFDDMDFEQVKQSLQSAGYTDVSADGPARKNAWFIMSNYIALREPNADEIINNFYLD